MSQANIDVVRALYDALNRGDWEAAMVHVSPQIEWETDPRHPQAGTYRGLHQFRRFMEDIEAPFEQTVTELEELFAHGDQVVVFIKIRRRPSGSTAELEIQIGELWTLRNGLLIRGQGFAERERALEAAGLPPPSDSADD